MDRLTEENGELLRNVAKLREINKTLISEKSALQRTIDSLKNTLRSVQEELYYWKYRYMKVLDFLETHSLRKKWEEFIKPKAPKFKR